MNRFSKGLTLHYNTFKLLRCILLFYTSLASIFYFCCGLSVPMFEWDSKIKDHFYILSGLGAKIIAASQNEQECIVVIAV